MLHIEEHIEIAAPPATVWAVVADLPAWPTWTPTVATIEVLDAGPPHLGQRARLRQPGYRPALWTVTRVAEGTGFWWETRTLGMTVTAGHAIRPTPAGSRVTLSIDVSGPTAALLGWIVARVSRRFLPQEAAGLRAASERR